MYVARAERAFVPQTVAVVYRACKDVSDRFDAAMRMPGETGNVVGRIFIPEIVEQQKGVEVVGLPESERAAEPHPCAFERWLCLNDAFHGSQ